MSGSVFKPEFTGNGPIAATLTVPPGDVYRILSVSCNFNIAPTSSENFTITLDDAHGPAYDLLLYTLDPAAGATSDILWQPEEELMLVGGDALDVLFDNTDGRTWGLVFTVKVVP
jgi:hypothetical protein